MTTPLAARDEPELADGPAVSGKLAAVFSPGYVAPRNVDLFCKARFRSCGLAVRGTAQTATRRGGGDGFADLGRVVAEI